MYVPTNTSYSCSNVGKTGMLKVNVEFLKFSICRNSPKAIATTMDIFWKILVVSLLLPHVSLLAVSTIRNLLVNIFSIIALSRIANFCLHPPEHVI